MQPDRDEKPATFDLALAPDGEVLGIGDSAFAAPGELGRVLAGAAQRQQCVVKQLFRYAYGRHEEWMTSRCWIGRMRSSGGAGSGFRLC